MTNSIPWSTVGYLTYKRTYARPVANTNRTEEFDESIERVVEACDKQLKVNFTKEEEKRLKYYLRNFKGSVAGRFWWQLGTETVNRFGLASLQNCAFTVIDHPIRPFTWCMDMLALGAGVGYNLQRKHVDKLPEVKEWFKAPTRTDDGGADFIIPDSREGWCKFLGKTLKAAFLSETENNGTFTYSTQVIRGKGKPIKGFGGVASGPEELCWGIQKISEILIKRAGKKVRPIDCLDIMNIIGHIIVAGNVRRSAQIAIGDPDDIEYLLAKNWNLGNIPAWRAMSNNSVACDDLNDLHEYFWKTYEGGSEPYGLINLNLSRKIGRLYDYQYSDPEVEGFNPCAEQSLAPYETCCLAEVFLPKVESKKELKDLVKLLYRICKHSLSLPCHHPETDAIVFKNMRMGIGMTGILEATEEQISWLDETYLELRQFDEEYSVDNGFNPSIKLTTVKPSGTLSLLPGVSPGIHPAYAKFMYRRIRIASDHQLVNICREHGYPIEYQLNFDGSEDRNTVVVTFPFRYSDNAVLAEDMLAISQLEWIKRLQGIWSDNSVSCTVYYTKEELPMIKAYLRQYYRNNFKSLSFLLHNEHGFKQAPYEEITEEQYNDLVSKTRVITGISVADFESNDECASGVCPIK
jgi:ribonucleotide reductase alpha subunit